MTRKDIEDFAEYMIARLPEYRRHMQQDEASRQPAAFNRCRNKKTRKIAGRVLPVIMDVLKAHYHFDVTRNLYGDCFKSTLSAGVNLRIFHPEITNISVHTGYFDRGIDQETIYHAWLTHDCEDIAEDNIVYNVSNVPLRPIYAIDELDFEKSNYKIHRLQKLGPQELADLAPKDGSPLKLRFNVNSPLMDAAFAPTLSAQKEYFERTRRWG